MTRVLYVEDNRQQRANIAEILTFEGYEVFEAEDGLSGIETAIRVCPDVILMDIEMPGMDGIGATARLKTLPRLAHIPIITLTANSSSQARERAMQAGCSVFLEKPVDITELIDAVAQAASSANRAGIPLFAHR